MLKARLQLFLFQCSHMERNDWEKLVDNLVKEGILHSPKIINALRIVPRTEFLPANMRSYDTVDTPLPIGYGQTISAPHSFSFNAELGETWSQ